MKANADLEDKFDEATPDPISNMLGVELRNHINLIRGEMINGHISVEDAEKKAMPYINEMNKRAKAIAKEYNKKHTPFNF